MAASLRRISRWLDGVEGLTLVHVGQPARRVSWFQIAWALLHTTALVMHVVSILYHVRRAVCSDESEALFVAGCPADHRERPVSLSDRRLGRNHEAHVAVS